MKFMFDENKKYRARACLTDEFLCLETLSGSGLYCSDPAYPCQLLPFDSDNARIGYEVLRVLQNSRIFTPEESDEYLYFESMQARYDVWSAGLMEKYKYKTKRALFKNMKNCPITCVDNIINIQPTRHTRLEQWDWGGHDNDVVRLPVISEPEEIGSALKQAFECCN
ncbi:contact-dependent growth inhibition system immunity protein [Salmonella enterica]|nr:DUF1436 family protein [Salmonella enterica subsp. enterica]EDN7239620.1 DUF1436 family protein [Salmonella enterica subsp. enterica serovar Thompson]EHI5877715.1 CdiI family contact-dependent growth inhibition immunity protein [Salmonella enterica]EDV3051899.1 DUF1436 family protein [Salmonella enterica subsp. enterica]EDW0273882.1 DUF1436 family protein [Salmonella enterica subsp. enterica serovar Thompson]